MCYFHTAQQIALNNLSIAIKELLRGSLAALAIYIVQSCFPDETFGCTVLTSQITIENSSQSYQVENLKLVLVAIIIAALSYIAATILPRQSYSGITIHLAGDSTMSIQKKSKRPISGWGEPFSSMVCDNVKVINHAKNGRSTKSFLTEGLWDYLLRQLQTGDIVMIQFGHNDQKKSIPELFSRPWIEYKENLQKFVSDVRSSGAHPILLTPIVRRVFNSEGELEQSLGEYPAVTRNVADQLNTPLIDANTATHKLIATMGPDESKNLYLHLAPGTQKNYIHGEEDDTHLNFKGAFEVAALVAVDLDNIHPDVICI